MPVVSADCGGNMPVSGHSFCVCRRADHSDPIFCLGIYNNQTAIWQKEGLNQKEEN